jgi:hypothetical protein
LARSDCGDGFFEAGKRFGEKPLSFDDVVEGNNKCSESQQKHNGFSIGAECAGDSDTINLAEMDSIWNFWEKYQPSGYGENGSAYPIAALTRQAPPAKPKL